MASLLLAAALPAQQPNQPSLTQAQIARWVEQLGHDDFAVRETATAHLADVIEEAEPVLRRRPRATIPKLRPGQAVAGAAAALDFARPLRFCLAGRVQPRRQTNRQRQWGPNSEALGCADRTGDPLPQGPLGSVWSVSFSPDGKQIASASLDGTVKLWDVLTGQESLSLKDHSSWVNFSPDGRRLASASADQTVKLWDALTGQESLSLKSHSAASGASASARTANAWPAPFRPHGESLGCPDRKGEPLPQGPLKQRLQRQLQPRRQTHRQCRHGPDGEALGCPDRPAVPLPQGTLGQRLQRSLQPGRQPPRQRSFDHTVKVWDAQTGKESLCLKGHSGRVTSVSFSPDGKRLASASCDGTVKVWRLRSRAEPGPSAHSFLAGRWPGQLLPAQATGRRSRRTNPEALPLERRLVLLLR